ncbi:BSD domain-containing protein 1-like [Vigna umbellata]|uniref:BSD domain-containing protein 1-like n=1 Tax=Vigna umbellata TaxID=87088 RepID=UPI001F5FE70C|nr:BSD domain-containing protein 1-like [Vigna umbellata]
MNFFKSVFSDEPESPPPGSPLPESSPTESEGPDPPQSNAVWSFGDLIQTLASKSESVLENYRRDFEEFGSGLRKETAVIREAASRAVKDLPTSLDVGAAVAQESLESVGQAIDDIGSTVWNSTAQIISHGRDSFLASDSDSFDSINYDSNNSNAGKKLLSVGSSDRGLDLKRYRRFDNLVQALQCDVNSYLEDPEDLEKFSDWKLGFELDKKEEEIRDLFEESGAVEEIYEKVVPSKTDHESFWSRYFYRLHKLKQAEYARAKLVKSAISGNEEEDLRWDFDDEDEDEDGNNGYEPLRNTSRVSLAKEGNSADVGGADTVQSSKKDLEIEEEDDGKGVENIQAEKKALNIEEEDGGKGVSPESKTGVDDKLEEGKYKEKVASSFPEHESGSGDNLDAKCEEKEPSEGKADNDNSGSCKDSDISVVSSQLSMPGEEEIGWDEIEDIESNDENKGDAVGSASRIHLQKRLSVIEQDEEDLSWDIEDEEEAVKS